MEQLGTDAYITGNVGSGTPQEMMKWVEYMTSDAISPTADLRRQNGREKPWRVPYFGIANEPWGCGGNMRAEYYADEYRKYNTSSRTTPQQAHLPHCGRSERPGLQVDRGADDLITKHADVMDRAEADMRSGPMNRPGADEKVGLVVDAWGTWYDEEPGTEPGFLYQQNSLRDALVAALNFHIFHRHADRVVMASIAQTVNVLQAMIPTDKEKMLRTPTHWVFEMFKVHQGRTFLPVELQSSDYAFGQ